MGNNSLVTRSSGEIITADFFNDFNTALSGDFIGRNASGVPTSGQNLGTAAIPWGIARFDSLILNGSTLDPSEVTVPSNRVVSGKTNTNSSLTNFLQAAGVGNGLSATLLAASTNLVLDINGVSVTFSSDVNITSLSAAPSTNNTCLVDDTLISNDKYAGESDAAIDSITIDTVGSEISSLVGERAAFKTATGEILFAYIKSAAELSDVYRGFYFDDGLAPIERGNLSNNDTLTLMKIGWVFGTNDGATTDVSYVTPVWSKTAPSSPSTGDYWYDMANNTWKRYSGAAFEIISRTLLGQLIMDDTDCIAARSLDAYFSGKEYNNIELEVFSTEIIQVKNLGSILNVYGTELIFSQTLTNWNITTDLESGVSEAASTDFYLYLSDEGEKIISDLRPHKRDDLKGYYHPYESWRCVGVTFNDSSQDLVITSEIPYNSIKKSALIQTGQEGSTGGGTSSTNTEHTRVLNFFRTEDEFGKVSSNILTILPGFYRMKAYGSVYRVNSHQTYIKNETDSTYPEAFRGAGMYASSSYDICNKSRLDGWIRIDTTKQFTLKHWTSGGVATNGLGFAGASAGTGNNSTAEAYASWDIVKLA